MPPKLPRGPIAADTITPSHPQLVFNARTRREVEAEILAEDQELAEEIESGGSWDAHSRLWAQSSDRLVAKYHSLTDDEKNEYEQIAIFERNCQWRAKRSVGELIENEESLAQKAEDEQLSALIGGRELNYLTYEQMKALVNGNNQKKKGSGGANVDEMSSLCAPFCEKEDANGRLKNMYGVLEDEEYA